MKVYQFTALLLACFLALIPSSTIAQSLDELIQEGNAASDAGNHEQAETIWRRIVQLNPSNATALNQWGVALANLGRLQEAIDALERALELSPNSSTIQENLAVAYQNLGIKLDEQGEIEAADHAYEQASGLDSRFLDELVQRGNRALDAANYERAEVIWHRIIRFDSNNANAHNNLGITLIEQEKFEEGISYIEIALELDPSNTEIRDNLAASYNDWGVALREVEELDRAIEAYEKAVEIDPTFAVAYRNLGVVLARQGQYEQAITALWTAHNLAPENDDIISNLAAAYNNSGLEGSEGAISDFQRAIDLNPNDPAAYINLGVVLRERGQLFEARRFFSRAVEIDPTNSVARNNLDAVDRDINGGRPLDKGVNIVSASENPNLLFALRSVVRITTSNGEVGTGWMIEREGETALILTNRHVIFNEAVNQPSTQIEVEFYAPPSQEGYQSLSAQIARITSTDTDLDLALLSVNNVPSSIEPLGISPNSFIASDVFIIGHPQRWGRDRAGTPIDTNWSIVRGQISNQNDVGLVIDANLASGNSGSPVLDQSYRVVGIMHSVIPPGSPNISDTAGIGSAYPISRVLQQLQVWGISIETQ